MLNGEQRVRARVPYAQGLHRTTHCLMQEYRLERPQATISRKKVRSRCQKIRVLPNGVGRVDWTARNSREVPSWERQEDVTIRRQGVRFLILLAFITGNSSLERLLEGLFAQIHIDLSWRGFGWNRTGDLRITPNLSRLSPALSSTEVWWRMHHRRSFRNLWYDIKSRTQAKISRKPSGVFSA